MRAPVPGIFIGLMLAGSIARGESRGNTPEFFYQPSAGVMALSFEGHQILSANTSTTSGGTKLNDIKIGNTGFGMEFGYGFTEAWAFTASMDLDNITLDVTDVANQTVTSYKRSGRSDVTLLLSNITAFGAWNLSIGLGAGLSPGKRLDASASADGNNLSGATSIINYLGLSSSFGSGYYWGGKVQYVTRTQGTGNTNTSSAQDYSLNGGNNLLVAAFLAADLAPFAADLTLSDQFIDPETETYGPGSASTHDAHQVLRAEAGAQYDFTPGVNLRITYQVSMFGEQVTNGSLKTAAYNESLAALRLRFEF